ncbi:MAG: glutathione S-transferase family protein, partial [Granulosicoccaceae bacterium]
WFLAISPNAQVPVLVTDGGKYLFESDAIAEYIDEVCDALEPSVSPEQRALDRAWSYQASKHYLVQCGAMSSATEKMFGESVEKMGLAFAKAEMHLGVGPFFKGGSLSNVDLAWLPLLHRAHIVRQRTGFDFLERFPKVRKWQAAIMATGIAERSVADDFEDVFAGFYLSGGTYLGAGQDSAAPANDCCEPSCCG